MPLQPTLQVRLFDNNLSSPTLIEDLTERVEKLMFSTSLNGGFRSCSFQIVVDTGEVWQYLSREGKRGYHFNRITVHDGQALIWEGRIVDIGLNVRSGLKVLKINASGYWSSMRDQFYTDSGGTDWSSGSGHEIHDIIKEILDDECPDISSDQTNIASGSRDLAGIDLTTKQYPQDLVNDLTKLSDSDGGIWFFAIWDARVPYLFKRSVAQVDWYVWLDSIGILDLRQSASGLRNAVLPFVGTTEGTTQTDATSLALYPRRETKLSLPTGSNANTQSDAASAAASEQSLPRQRLSFRIDGRIYSVANGLQELPLWRVRAGEVLRIQHLVPNTAATPSLDDVRTFYIMQTEYDATSNQLTIQPDRRRLGLVDIVGNVAKASDVVVE